MADLIDRAALIAEYDRVHVGVPGGARKLMVDAPSVDAEPVRYAEWIPDDYEYNHCSGCGFEHDTPEYVTPFCPLCGAKMDEDIENE